MGIDEKRFEYDLLDINDLKISLDLFRDILHILAVVAGEGGRF